MEKIMELELINPINNNDLLIDKKNTPRQKNETQDHPQKKREKISKNKPGATARKFKFENQYYSSKLQANSLFNSSEFEKQSNQNLSEKLLQYKNNLLNYSAIEYATYLGHASF